MFAPAIVALAESALVTGVNPVARLKLTVAPSVMMVSTAASVIGRLLTSCCARSLEGPANVGKLYVVVPAGTSTVSKLPVMRTGLAAAAPVTVPLTVAAAGPASLQSSTYHDVPSETAA